MTPPLDDAMAAALVQEDINALSGKFSAEFISLCNRAPPRVSAFA